MNNSGLIIGNRYEIKIPVVGVPLYQIKRWINCHPAFFKPLHPPRQVNNVYFDTNDQYAFQSHLDGYTERIKFRLRWYGKENIFSNSQFELKRKHGEVGNKQYFLINELFNLANDDWKKIKAKVVKQLPAYPCEQVAIQNPILINFYQREYFQSIDKKIRLTLDYGLKYLDQRMYMRPNLRYCLPAQNMIILELKAGINQYKEIVRVVSAFPVRGEAISKFVTGLSLSGGM